MLNGFFKLTENRTTVRTEVLAGVTTFLTMAYIIFLQPAILSGSLFGMNTGMDFGAVTVATCLASALTTAIMGLYGRYPIALAPGMGENFFFVLSAIPAAATLAVVKQGQVQAWQVALGVVFISGIPFTIVSVFKIREMVMNAISPSLKNGIAVGIGLFIAFIGLQNAGVIIKDPGTAVKLNTHFGSPDLAVFFFGLILTAVLHVRRVRGSILWGILGGTLFAMLLKFALPHAPAAIAAAPEVAQSMLLTRFTIADRVVSLPPSIRPVFLKLDIVHAFSATMLPFILIFLFMDVFDTIGTLIGVSEQAGFMKDNKLPNAGRVLLSDSVGTLIGAAAGTSTMTSFIESAAGVEQGGRTGLTALTTAVLFLLALFFSPLIGMVGNYAPITAPALVIVGAMMIRNVRKIDWDDYSECIPAFLTLLGVPLCYSIADGLALGFISYPIIKLFGGRGREVGWLPCVMAVVLVFYFVFVRARI